MSIQIVKIKRALTQAVGAPNKNGRFRCPCHGGYDFNLALRDTAKKVQITCFSHGCSAKSILESVGLSTSDMYYERIKKAKLYDSKSANNAMYYERAQQKGYLPPEIKEYLTPQIKDRLTPDEVSKETAIIETYARDLEDSHIEINAFDGYRAKVAKARLHRHYKSKQGDSQ